MTPRRQNGSKKRHVTVNPSNVDNAWIACKLSGTNADCMDRGMHGSSPGGRMSWTPRVVADTQPLYLAIADAIAADAESGRLAPGTRLPTHRALARTLG